MSGTVDDSDLLSDSDGGGARPSGATPQSEEQIKLLSQQRGEDLIDSDDDDIFLGDIGIDENGRFTDLDDRIITTLVKLYPWEWIMLEDFGQYVPDSSAQFIEPPWKTILSNKGLLPLLWGMFEGHPNLLPAFFEDDPASVDFANNGGYFAVSGGDGYIRVFNMDTIA